MFEEIKPHIKELRSRLIKIILVLIVLFLIAFNFWEFLLQWFKEPLMQGLKENSHVIAKTLPEQIISAIIVSFFASLVVGMPFYLYQIWAFIAPGLYAHEKKFVVPFVFFASLMFLAGCAFAYYIVFPYGFEYLANFGGDAIVAMISIGDYVGFFLKLMFGFALSFELPVVCFFLAKMGLITDKSLISFFRYAIIIIFALAAILTPPDVITQSLMAMPLILLYALSILIAKIVNPYKQDE